jgi:uncharacterized OsmC-like protein
LLSRSSDAVYVAHVVAAWAERYLDMAADTGATQEIPEGTVLVRETRDGQFQQEIAVGKHRLLADEPGQVGGMDTGPGPYDLLLAALGACTSMTIRLYADRKQIPLERTLVHLRHEKIYAADWADCETKEGKIDHIDREITFEGDLEAATRARLLEIANKCPVHRTPKSEVDIRTVEKPADWATRTVSPGPGRLLPPMKPRRWPSSTTPRTPAASICRPKDPMMSNKQFEDALPEMAKRNSPDFRRGFV